jgi:hypothetical protein
MTVKSAENPRKSPLRLTRTRAIGIQDVRAGPSSVADHAVVADSVSSDEAPYSVKGHCSDCGHGSQANQRPAHEITLGAVQAGNCALVIVILDPDSCVGHRTQDRHPQKRNRDRRQKPPRVALH